MQKSRNRKIKNYNNNNKSKKLGFYFPIIFTITILPLVFYGKIIELPLMEANYWKGGITHIDFFHYYKAIILNISTVIFLLAYGGLYLENRLPLQKEHKYYIFMLTYIIMVFISTIMSNYKHVASIGFIEMYQGFFVLISYIVLTFILINFIIDERDITVIVNSFVVLICIEGILGLGQYFGHDFFRTSLGQWLVSPSEIKGNSLGFSFGEFTIYGTLYNTNFVGSFAAIVLPLSTILYLFEDNRKKSLLFLIVALLAFTTWLGCNSRAGYLGITAASILGLIVFRKIIKKQYKKIIVLFTGFIIIAFIFNTTSEGRVFNQFSRLNPVTEAEKIQNVNEKQQVRFEEVSIKDNTFTVKTNKETLIGVIENSNIIFNDGNGIELKVNTNDKGIINFIDDKYSGYNFTIDNQFSYIKAELYGRRWDLYVAGDNKLKVISFNNKLADPIEAPRIKLFDGKETFASNRGYIWSRTIPMLKDTLFIGYGPDNYPMVFPQEDYVGRFNVGNRGMLDIVIDKPHNMYLQTAVNTGVVSLLALLAIWGMYLLDSLKIYVKGDMESFIEYMGAATFLSITAYLVAGIFNDSVVSVAPLFWILLGMGIGINRMVKENNLLITKI